MTLNHKRSLSVDTIRQQLHFGQILHFKFWNMCRLKIRDECFRKQMRYITKTGTLSQKPRRYLEVYLYGKLNYSDILQYYSKVSALYSLLLGSPSSKCVFSLHGRVWQSLKISSWSPILFCSFQCKSHKMLTKKITFEQQCD